MYKEEPTQDCLFYNSSQLVFPAQYVVSSWGDTKNSI